jgi:long-chain fatty acid transport protein
MKLPQQVAFSAFHQLTDDVAIMADVNWQDWSSFGKLPISVDSANTRSFTADLNMKDTYHVGIGATYQFLEGWQYSIGAAYDTSAYSDKNRIAALPVDEQIRVGTGVQYNMTDKITLGAAYEYLNLGKGRLEQSNSLGDTLSGKYSTNEVHFVNVTLNWKF